MLSLLLPLLETATEAVRLKQMDVRRQLRRAAVHSLHIKAVNVTQGDLVKALMPVFKRQVASMVSKLGGASKSFIDEKASAQSLAKRIINPKQWTDEIKTAVMPVLAFRMAEAARNQLIQLGVKRKRLKSFGEKYNPNHDELGRFAEGGGAGGSDIDGGIGGGGNESDESTAGVRKYAEKEESFVQNMLVRSAASKVETGFMLDENSGDVRELSGTRDALKLTREDFDFRNDPNRAVVDVHTHPPGNLNPPSMADVKVYLDDPDNSNAIVRGVVYSENGKSRYEIIPQTRFVTKEDAGVLVDAWMNVRKVLPMGLNSRERTFLEHHAILLSLKSRGIISYDYKFGPKSQKIASKFESFFQQFHPEASKSFSSTKYNPNHDELGRFAEGEGGGGGAEGDSRQAVQDYTADHFRRINAGLRDGTVDDSDAIVRGVDKYLSESPKRVGVTVRSFDADPKTFDDLRKMLRSGEFTDKAYISTRKTPTITDKHAFQSKDAPAGHVVLRIDGKSGVDVSDFSMNPGEGEVLYPRGTVFRVDKLVETRSGGLLAELTEMRGSKAFVKSTATDWLESQEDLGTLLDDAGLWAPGSLPYQIVTELPEAMKQRISESLRESFQQDYWDNISETTQGNAETILEEGLRNGWSIRDMAKELRERLGGDEYARTRANNIARTESGNALNAARKGVMDQVRDDLGDEVPVATQWLSVLSNTTRDTHAALDGVPADKDGLWDLSGYMIPWPGHVSLPPEERCNCMCSVTLELGMREDEAGRLIEDYYSRQEEEE